MPEGLRAVGSLEGKFDEEKVLKWLFFEFIVKNEEIERDFDVKSGWRDSK